MLRLPYKSAWRVALGTVLLPGAGCQTAWMGNSESSRQENSRGVAAASPVDPVHPAVVNQQSLSTVMDEVRAIGLRDPAAQQRLVDQLRHSKPELWPLVVEQFRSSLAMHEQLAAKGTRVAATARAEPASPMWPSAEPRPSAEVGALVDPRGIRPDPAVEDSLPVATPANMPPPHDPNADALVSNSPYGPQPFAGAADAQPIKLADHEQAAAPPADRYAAQPGDRSAVALASYTSASEPHDMPPLSRSESAGDRSPLGWQQHLELAIDDLSRRVSDSPQSTAEVHQQVSLRLLELLAGDTEQALRPIPKVSTAEQDYWSHQVFALASFLDHHTQPDDKRRAAAAVTHLDEAVGNLRELGSLSLRNLTFCEKVYDYGAYDPHKESRFSPGQQVTLYVEVENYHSKSTAEGYCTSLGTSYELLDESGERVDGGEFPDVEDCCRSRRRDFHIQYGLVLPKAMLPGNYRLELAMKDRRSDKRGHASIALEIK
jgi:hypothetical protein